MVTAPAPAPKLDSITGLRFLSALAVFLFHISIFRLFADNDISDGLFRTFSKAGWIGVSFFFMLSGFILTWSARPGDRARAFWRRRLVKVVPNHLVTYAAAMALYAAVTVSAGTAVLNLLLLQPWVPSEDVFFSVNNPSWSLGCELFFYLLFPALHAGLSRLSHRTLWWLAGAVTTTVLLLPLLATVALPGEPTLMAPDKPAPLYGFWFVYILPATRVLDFTLGILIARILLTGRRRPIPLLPVAGLFVACYMLALYVPAIYALNAATVVPLMLLIPAVATLDLTGGNGFLRSRPLRRLGEISFAFYLVQWPVIVVGHDLLGADRRYSTPIAVLLALAALAVSITLAWLLHIAVERPVVRRWSRPRRPAPPAPPVPRQRGAADRPGTALVNRRTM